MRYFFFVLAALRNGDEVSQEWDIVREEYETLNVALQNPQLAYPLMEASMKDVAAHKRVPLNDVVACDIGVDIDKGVG